MLRVLSDLGLLIDGVADQTFFARRQLAEPRIAHIGDAGAGVLVDGEDAGRQSGRGIVAQPQRGERIHLARRVLEQREPLDRQIALDDRHQSRLPAADADCDRDAESDLSRALFALGRVGRTRDQRPVRIGRLVTE